MVSKTTRHIIIIIAILIFIISTIISIYGAINQEPHFKIIKEDLTMDWLEKNCQKSSPSRYQCEEFSVEVWKQIK